MVRAPEFDEGADTLVVESTYGNRHHPQIDTQEELKNAVLRTRQRQGILLIPSFAVGRAQLLLYYIHCLKKAGEIPKDLPVYLNSPMAAEANRAFTRHHAELKISKAELDEMWTGVKIVKSADESKALNEKTEPAIIIAASGMATGGRVLHHLKSVAPHAQNSILFVGFQAGGTRGDLIVRGAKEIKIHGEYWPIKAEVINMETLSAHADAEEILTWIGKLKKKPQRIFVTHGEPEAADTLRRSIEEKLKISASVPEYLQKVELT
jgi:metallo-beta-lactamase family protein